MLGVGYISTVIYRTPEDETSRCPSVQDQALARIRRLHTVAYVPSRSDTWKSSLHYDCRL